MDQKAWLWRKKSAEKTIVSKEKINSSSFKGYEEEQQVELFSSDKPELEKDYRELNNNKLSSAIWDCDSKDDLLRKHEKDAKEAIAGREKAESEAMCLKKQLDESFKQRIASEERIAHLDLALKECAQQLRFFREDQERRIQETVIKASKEFEKSQLLLEEKLEETSKRLAKAVIENAHLSQSLLTKEKSIEDLKRQRRQMEADFNALMSRLDSVEKDNGSLKYEVRVLEKELEIRNEEREFNRRTADVSHKQHLESAKRIVRLESECQTLRILVRKRLPGPAAIAKMKNEADVLGRRKKSDSLTLTEQLLCLEEQNKNLKEALSKRMSHEISSDMGSDDKASCAESWASALISELEHFKGEKQRKFGASDISLMDDFAEMERFAVISVDETPRSQLSVDALISKLPSSLQRILETVMKQERDPDEVLEDIKTALEPKQESLAKVDTNKSVSKIIELIEGINFPSQKDSNFYTVHVLQWKSSELGTVLQRFLHTCYDLLSKKAEQCKFAEELGFALEWILNHCFSLQDVSSMREEIMKHFDWDEEKTNVEEALRNQCDELESTVKKLRNEMENYKLENLDLDRQLSVAKVEVNEARENLSSIEVELENKSSVCEELESTCLDLQLQLESIAKSEIPSSDFPQEEKKFQSNWEISAASEKLAECQETILNLGKQLKALASPKEAALFDQVVVPNAAATDSALPKKASSHRASLLDQMIAEDGAKANGKPLKGNPESVTNGLIEIQEKLNGTGGVPKVKESPGGSLAIMPVKSERSTSLWRKLLWRKRKGSSKKSSAL